MDDVATTFIQENLSGYNLPADTLVEIHGILTKRFTVKFSEGLSPEGRMAMELTARRETGPTTDFDKGDIDYQETSPYIRRGLHKRRSKTISFTGTFEGTPTNKYNKDAPNSAGIKHRRSSSAKLGKDVTNSHHDISETITTKQNVESNELHSLEKCLVWMETQDKTPTENNSVSDNLT